MKKVFVPVMVVMLAMATQGARSAQPAQPDSAQFVGWRGNWTGKFPNAEAPVTWSKLSKPLKGLRCQAEKPKDNRSSGVPAGCGSLTQWLVLGPFPAAGDAKSAINEVFIKDEATCVPKEGETVHGVPWRKAGITGSLLDFDSALAGDMPKDTPMNMYSGTPRPPYAKPYIAYATTWVYSDMDASFQLRVRAQEAAKIWIDGVPLQGMGVLSQHNSVGGQFPVKMKKGWHQILCKVRNEVVPQKSWYGREVSSWYIDLGLRAARPFETVSEGIAWAAPLPVYHISNPLIVGDRIFAMARPADVVCLNKADGKVLWIRSTTLADVAGDKDKQNPTFAQIPPLVDELRRSDAAYAQRGVLSEDMIRKRVDLHLQIQTLMAQIDGQKYAGDVGHYPQGSMPTPVSDGKNIYVWSELGIATCFNLDGNRKWITMPGVKGYAPGRYSSPVLADGKMIVVENPQEPHKGGLVALDASTGKIAWNIADKNPPEPFSSLVPVKIGGEDCVLYGGRLVRAKDGTVLLENPPELICHIPTPVIENGIMYGIRDGGGIVMKAKLPTALGKMAMTNEGKVNCPVRMSTCPVIASPLYHEGLLYIMDQSGELYVIDVEAQKLVYERDLGLGKGWPIDFYHNSDWGWTTNYSSPTLAGKHIYVFGMSGTAVVFEPGREYKEVARNQIEDSQLSAMGFARGQEIPEFFASCPVAEGKRLYVRGGNYLYCIGK